MVASFVPFGVAMAGAPSGPFADVTTMGVFFLALGLQIKRPVFMPQILARAHAVTGLAFALDAVRTGQPLRFIGTGVCIALVAWMIGIQPPGYGVPGPA